MAISTFNITAVDSIDFFNQVSTIMQSNGWTLIENRSFCAGSFLYSVLEKNGLYLSIMNEYIQYMTSTSEDCTGSGGGLFYFNPHVEHDPAALPYNQPTAPSGDSIRNVNFLRLITNGVSISWPISAHIAIDNAPDKWTFMVNVKLADPTARTYTAGLIDFEMPAAIAANTTDAYQDVFMWGGSYFGSYLYYSRVYKAGAIRKYASGGWAGWLNGAEATTATVLRYSTSDSVNLYNAMLDQDSFYVAPGNVYAPDWNIGGRGGFSCVYMGSLSHQLDPVSEQVNLRLSSVIRADAVVHLNESVDITQPFNIGVNQYSFFPFVAQSPKFTDSGANHGILIRV